MMPPPVVRLARAGEAGSAAAVLADAFVDEAGLNFWLRQGGAKDRARRQFFDAAVGDIVHKERKLWLAEDDGEPLGAAIWLGPGQKAYALSLVQYLFITPLLLSIAGVSGAMRGLDLGDRLAQHHPEEPHAHLVFLGVASAAQGRGVGSAILKRTLEPLDQAGLASFLETTTERNVALYKRHGFEITAELVLPGLHCWSMKRNPQR